MVSTSPHPQRIFGCLTAFHYSFIPCAEGAQRLPNLVIVSRIHIEVYSVGLRKKAVIHLSSMDFDFEVALMRQHNWSFELQKTSFFAEMLSAAFKAADVRASEQAQRIM
jgi:hypothetical protein